MNKRKVGITLGILSVFPVIISIIFFITTRGPNADIYVMINIFTVLSLVGIILSILSFVYLWLSKEPKGHVAIGSLGLIANSFVLVFAFFLRLAMGIGEP